MRDVGPNGLLVAVAAVTVGCLLALASLGGTPGGDGGAQARTPGEASGDTPGGYLGSTEGLDGASFEGTEVGGLSALAYDPRRDLYYALVDRRDGEPARYYSVRLPLQGGELGEPEIFDVTVLRDGGGRPFGAGGLDGEGIALTDWGDLLVASESGPRVMRFAPDGRLLGELAVPDKYLVSTRGGGVANATFEGVAVAPGGGTVFAAPQVALRRDQPQDSAGVRRTRLLRYAARGVEDPRPDAELFYFAGLHGGVADVAALSENELLVLEHGNTVFRVDLSGARDVSGVANLTDTEVPPLEKELVVDLDDCGPGGDEAPDYEGMALGPELPGGGRALVFLSDDDFAGERTTVVSAVVLPGDAGDVCPQRLPR